MYARELAESFPTLPLTAPALEAARILGRQNLPGLIVVGKSGAARAVLSGDQVLRAALPVYCLEDPALVRVIDAPAADIFADGLAGRTVADCLPPHRGERAVVGPEATVLEIAALMARTGTPIVAVNGGPGQVLGAVTIDALLDRMIGA